MLVTIAGILKFWTALEELEDELVWFAPHISKHRVEVGDSLDK